MHLSTLISEFSYGYPVAFCPLPGDAGAALTAFAARLVFRSLDIEPDTISYLDKVRDSVIFIGGDGVIDFSSGSCFRTFAENNYRQNEKIVVLPQSITGITDSFLFPDNLTIICREEESYNKLKRAYFQDDHLFLCHDIIFSLSENSFPYKETRKFEYGNCFNANGKPDRLNCLPKDNFDIQSWWSGDFWTNPQSTTKVIDKLALYLYHHPLIRTDRLAVALMAALAGNEVYLYSDSTAVNKNVYEHSMKQRFNNIHYIDDVYFEENKQQNDASGSTWDQLKLRAKQYFSIFGKVRETQSVTDGQANHFSLGTRPVIRWIKGNGLDDEVTRAAIAQATRLFGHEVDYCLCTEGIDAHRAREILAWAMRPVEWRPVNENDNPLLAKLLRDAGCLPENFGYWWKWFPERIRPDAPEWILDGDMVITGKPAWFSDWAEGRDGVRITQDDLELPVAYGQYARLVDPDLKFYSGLVSLPSGLRYMPAIQAVLLKNPLKKPHNGKKDMCEQGVVSVAFQSLGAKAIPLHEFPFCRAFEGETDYGLTGNQHNAWGYHFGNAFRMANPHFERMSKAGIVFSQPGVTLAERFHWLGGTDQWGFEGWSMPDHFIGALMGQASLFAGKPVLDAGTSRGRIAALFAACGCKVTTVDHTDRGAQQNLSGLDVQVVTDDIDHFLESNETLFDLIFLDLHGNSETRWKKLAPRLPLRLNRGGRIILNNATLFHMPEWREETGVGWFLHHLPEGWHAELLLEEPPGLAVCIFYDPE
jgi:predicted O-methyltransferase YrrM